MRFSARESLGLGTRESHPASLATLERRLEKMNESEIKYFTVDFLLKGRSDWFEYRIPHPEWDRLRTLFNDQGDNDLDRLDHVAFRTSERRSVLFRTDDVLAMRFLWDPLVLDMEDEPNEDEEEDERVLVFFAGREEPFEIEPGDRADTYPFVEFIRMDSGRQRPFIGVTDIEGEEVIVNAAEVILIEYSANAEAIAWERVEEDMRRALQEGDSDEEKEPPDNSEPT